MENLYLNRKKYIAIYHGKKLFLILNGFNESTIIGHASYRCFDTFYVLRAIFPVRIHNHSKRNAVNPPAILTDVTKAFVCYSWHTCTRRLTRPPIFTRAARIEIHDYCNHGLFPELVCEDWR